jgi:hypothetical protein
LRKDGEYVRNYINWQGASKKQEVLHSQGTIDHQEQLVPYILKPTNITTTTYFIIAVLSRQEVIHHLHSKGLTHIDLMLQESCLILSVMNKRNIKTLEKNKR